MMTNEIILVAVRLVVLILSVFIGKYIIPWLREKVNVAYLSEAAAWAETFVKSAEMIITGEKMGEEKLNKVTEWLTDKLAELGIVMSQEETRAIIEEAVYNLNQEK